MRIRKSYKKRMVLIVMILATFILMGCTSTKNENEILEDFINKEDSLSFLDFHTLTIDKRQTNKEKKEDIVYATVEGTGKYAKHTYQCKLLYNYYEKGGWILEDITLKAVTVSNIQRRSDEEIKKFFEENANKLYIPGQYDTLTGEVSNIVEPQEAEEIILEKDEIDMEDTESNYIYDDSVIDESTNKTYFHGKDGNYFYISYSCEISFELSYSSTISYSANGTYYLGENYNIETGEWEYGGGSHVVENQSIDNLENIVFIGTPNDHGYYQAGYLRQDDNTTFSWYEKSFDNNNQELIFDWEEPYKVEGGFLNTYLIENVDLISGFNIYMGKYSYPENKEPYFVDDSEEGHRMVIYWDNGEINFTNRKTIFSILSTTGEYPNGEIATGDALSLRKSLF